MYKIRLKKTVLPVIFFLAGITLASGSIAFQLAQFNVALPVLLIGAFSFFLVINLLMYTKATTTQILILSLINFLIFSIICAASVTGMKLTGFGELSLSENHEITTSLAAILISVLSSLLSIKSAISFEIPVKSETTITEETEKPNTETKIQDQKQIEITPEPIINNYSQAKEIVKPEPVVIPPVIPQSQYKSEKQIIAEEKPTTIIETEQLPKQNPAPLEELKSERLEESTSLDSEIQPMKEQVLEQVDNIFESPLKPLPDISFEEDLQISGETKEQPAQAQNNIPEEEDIFVYEDTDEYIPQNIRLVDTPKSKKFNQNSSSTISSIGKLLVNFRDIENIIQINDIMQQIGCESEGKQIVSLNAGVKVYERFNKILVDYQGIKNLMLVDRAGFIIASIIEHEDKEQNLGAISSVAFLILQNYLNQLHINDLQKVLFITEDVTITLFKIEDNILSFSIDQGFEFINFNEIDEYMNKDTIEHYELPLIKNIKNIEEVVITDRDGKLVDAIYTGVSKRLASISSAIIENMKIFITNVHPSPLKRIVLIANEKTITINKYPDDKIIAYLSEAGYPIQLTQSMSQIEEIVSNKG